MTVRIVRNQFILLTGISGSGKTEYGRYLERTHKFHFIETDVCIPFIELATSPNNPLNVDIVNRYIDMREKVVVEWGFVVPYLHYVMELKKQGAKLFWFTAPDNVAFRGFLSKYDDTPHNRRAWELQRDAQRREGLPTTEFRIIQTTRPDGSYKRPEELDDSILP